jgi:hypothetical protein
VRAGAQECELLVVEGKVELQVRLDSQLAGGAGGQGQSQCVA